MYAFLHTNSLLNSFLLQNVPFGEDPFSEERQKMMTGLPPLKMYILSPQGHFALRMNNVLRKVSPQGHFALRMNNVLRKEEKKILKPVCDIVFCLRMFCAMCL